VSVFENGIVDATWLTEDHSTRSDNLGMLRQFGKWSLVSAQYTRPCCGG